MKRLRRITFNALTALSLVLCLATAGVWVRSHWIVDSLQWYRGDHYTRVWHSNPAAIANRGTLTVGVVGTSNPSHAFLWQQRIAFKPDAEDAPDERIWCGFGYSRERLSNWRGHGQYSMTFVSLPFWFATLLTAAAPAAWLRGKYKRGQFPKGEGMCSRCSYDLRATPNRCPECGTIPAKEKT